MSHLGIVSALAAAEKGFEVIGFDPDESTINALQNGNFPVFEPGLSELYSRAQERIQFSSSMLDISDCELLYISRDIPTNDKNESDTSPVDALLETVIPNAKNDSVVVILCQVRPGFTRAVSKRFASELTEKNIKLCYQVETLVFGDAVDRALRPERFIVGLNDISEKLPTSLSTLLESFDCPILPMRLESAELAKISINLFLVSSITTTNTLAEICERTGADWEEIAPALRLDKRIGKSAYLSPGLGIAGGNLERDLVSILSLSSEHGTNAGVVSSWLSHLDYRRDWLIRNLHHALCDVSAPQIGLLGLAYKPGTHSMKNAPSAYLLESFPNFLFRTFDPLVKPENNRANVQLCDSAMLAAEGATAVVIATPWPEFRELDLPALKQAMTGNVVLDPFRVLEREKCLELGFRYYTLGTD